MNHNVNKLALCKVIIVGDGYLEIIQFLAEPYLTIATLEIATSTIRVQQVKLREKQLSLKILHVALIKRE
jgi:hypothetical protein